MASPKSKTNPFQSILDPDAIYSDSTGYFFCGSCAGASAATTGRDRYGNEILKFRTEDLAVAAETGTEIACERCGKTLQREPVPAEERVAQRVAQIKRRYYRAESAFHRMQRQKLGPGIGQEFIRRVSSDWYAAWSLQKSQQMTRLLRAANRLIERATSAPTSVEV